MILLLIVMISSILKLSKVQLQESLNHLLLKENGLTTVLEMTLNSLMYAELLLVRESFRVLLLVL